MIYITLCNTILLNSSSFIIRLLHFLWISDLYLRSSQCPLKEKRGRITWILEVIFLMWTVKQHETKTVFKVNTKQYVNRYLTQLSYNQFTFPVSSWKTEGAEIKCDPKHFWREAQKTSPEASLYSLKAWGLLGFFVWVFPPTPLVAFVLFGFFGVVLFCFLKSKWKQFLQNPLNQDNNLP